MDYTTGAIEAPRSILIDRAIEIMGPMQKGNSLFVKEHLYDLIDDGKYYCLTTKMAMKIVFDLTKARPWIAQVCDCDTRTILFAADIIDEVRQWGWKKGCAIWRLKYDSISLSKDIRVRLKGYHATPLLWTFDEDIMHFIPWVVQPKILYKSGNTKDSQWDTPKKDVVTRRVVG